jgi:hypothetical protein
MGSTFTLYERVVRVTHIYLGPAADRFIDRQVQNHLDKDPEKLTASDLVRLIDWIQVAVSLLTDDQEIVEEYIEQLKLLSTGQTKRRKAKS